LADAASTECREPSASTLRVNSINMVLVVLSCVAAFLLPFEVFLFSYAVLGPLHYLTQISWMHDRRYFTSGGARGDAVFLAGMAVCVGSITLGLPELSEYNPSIAFVAFGVALLMTFAKQTQTKVVGALALLGVSFLMRRWDHFGLTFGAFLPTVIHVCLYTACFVLVGAMKSRDWSGAGLLALYSICAGSCFLLVPATHSSQGDAQADRRRPEPGSLLAWSGHGSASSEHERRESSPPSS
jgi:hypothetical protein